MTASAQLRERGDERLHDRLQQLLGGPVALEELKHKPGRRLTRRARGPEGTAIVKQYASDRAATVAARVAALEEGPPEPLVPRLLLLDPALRMVVLSDVPGRPLREALLAADAATCRRAGKALGAWHRSWQSRTPQSLRPHTVGRELELLDQRAEQTPLAEAVRSAARDLSRPWSFPTVVHRDLYEEQILCGEQIGLIDLDDAALGPPELDVGNLLAHVELLSFRSGVDLAAMGEHFLAGYTGSGAVLEGGLLDRCRQLSLLRLACIHDEPSLLVSAEGDAR